MILRKRRVGLSLEQFIDRLEHEQAPCGKLLPGLTHYVQSRTLPQAYRGREPAYDCAEELEFETQGALEEAGRSDHWRGFIGEDRALFDVESTLIMATDVHLAKSGDTSEAMVKGLLLVRALESLTEDVFERYWSDVHGPIAARIPTLIRYEQNRTRRLDAINASTVYQGIAVTWFDSTQAMKLGSQTAEYAALKADEPNLLSPKEAPYLITSEHSSFRH